MILKSLKINKMMNILMKKYNKKFYIFIKKKGMCGIRNQKSKRAFINRN